MGGAAKFKREKSNFDRYGYKLTNASFAAKYVKIAVTKEELTENARLRTIRELCAQIRDQDHLNEILAAADEEDRRAIYETYLPYLDFFSVYPD